MSTLVTLGLANAVCAALLALIALLVGRWCRCPAVLHSLWLLVLLKLVTPPFWPVTVANLPSEPAAPVEGPTPAVEYAISTQLQVAPMESAARVKDQEIKHLSARLRVKKIVENEFEMPPAAAAKVDGPVRIAYSVVPVAEKPVPVPQPQGLAWRPVMSSRREP